MSRRLMYYWNILQKDESELVKKFFNTQKLLISKNDWILQLKNDIELCNITLSEDRIKQMKKEAFKNLVKSKISRLTKEYLINLRSTHSKSVNLLHTNCIKDYLKTDLISVEEKKVIFSMKTRSVNVKTNMKANYSHLLCRLCFNPNEEESELHIMTCEKVKHAIDVNLLFRNIAYRDIFGTLEKQICAVKVWKKVLKVWNMLLENAKLSPSGPQVHLPLQGLSDLCASSTSLTMEPAPSDGLSSSSLHNFG